MRQMMKRRLEDAAHVSVPSKTYAELFGWVYFGMGDNLGAMLLHALRGKSSPPRGAKLLPAPIGLDDLIQTGMVALLEAAET